MAETNYHLLGRTYDVRSDCDIYGKDNSAKYVQRLREQRVFNNVNAGALPAERRVSLTGI